MKDIGRIRIEKCTTQNRYTSTNVRESKNKIEEATNTKMYKKGIDEKLS